MPKKYTMITDAEIQQNHLNARSLPIGKTIMVISPHPDDSCISVGGMIARCAANNDIHVVVMTSGHRAHIDGADRQERIAIRKDETRKECEVLSATPHFMDLGFYDEGEKHIDGDIKTMLQELEELHPDIVFLPHHLDSHQTHLTSRKIMLEAIKMHDRPLEIWHYETLWAPFRTKHFNTVVPLAKDVMERKMQAIRCHASQIKRTPYDRAAKALATFRAVLIPEQELSSFGDSGIQVGSFVEVFQTGKLINYT